jgi:hypothetical protein
MDSPFQSEALNVSLDDLLCIHWNTPKPFAQNANRESPGSDVQILHLGVC